MVGGEVVAVVVLSVGIGVVAFALWVFLYRGGYADLEEFPDSVEHAHLRRVAEARISGLCPGAIRLAEKERTNRGASAESSGPARDFWRRFAGASAAVDEDPVAALRELRGLPDLLNEALVEAERETGPAKGVAERDGAR